MKVFAVAGYSGAGKTVLIEKLLAVFKARGIRVSVVKQSHHDVALDQPGKDSWRHRQAGAQEVLLTTPHRWQLVRELRGEAEPELEELCRRFSPCDLVLVEGFRHADLPKLEVWRAATGKPWLHPQDANVLGLASDTPLKPLPAGHALPYFQLDAVEAIADFILARARPL
jgi:molybdopterin-guanine dinucleotide biosynthesis protein B